MDKKIKPEYHAWVKHLWNTMPQLNKKISRFYDENEKCSIDIFFGQDKKGCVAATIGAMDKNISRNPASKIFTEILMDVRGHNDYLENVVSTIGFYIIKDGWKPAPGVVFEQMIEMYNPKLHVKHVLFVPSFQWGDGMSKVDLGVKTIHPLLAVPITDSEYEYIQANGADQLEDLWERKNCDVMNWNRKGIL